MHSGQVEKESALKQTETTQQQNTNTLYLERKHQTDCMNRGYGGEDDDSHRAGSDQRRRSEGQKNAHTPLHGDDHGQTARAEEKARVHTHDEAAYCPFPPRLKVRPDEADQAVGTSQKIEEDEHPVDQGQTEQAQVHPVLQTCAEELKKKEVSAGKHVICGIDQLTDTIAQKHRRPRSPELIL